MVKHKFKKLTLSLLLSLPLMLSNIAHAADEDVDYKFASTPFEYASLMSPSIKPNLIFLVDNSTFAVPVESQEIIRRIISDPEIERNTRGGLAFLYANSHPFVTFEIPTAFIACTVRYAATTAVTIAATIAGLVSAGAITIGTGGVGIVAFAPILAAIFPIITANTAAFLNACGSRLVDPWWTQFNIKINSQVGTFEVPINDLTLNRGAMLTSLAGSFVNGIVPLGLPTITRRYYEITREIRGLPQVNSFYERPSNQITDNVSSGLSLIQQAIAFFPIASFIPVVGSMLQSTLFGIVDGIDKIIQLGLGSVPSYKPLFTNTMLYRCQPNFVVVLSPAVVTPAMAQDPIGIIQILSNTLNGLINSIGPVVAGALLAPGLAIALRRLDINRYLPIPDLLPLNVPPDDELVRNHVYHTEEGESMHFNEWYGVELNSDLLKPFGVNIRSYGQQYSNHGLAFLSTLFDKSDLKTGGRDQEGQSWDSEDYPFQNITTITINTGKSDSLGMLGFFVNSINDTVARPKYLEKAASYIPRIGRKAYFQGLASADEVKKIVRENIMAINTNNISNASSTVLSQMNPHIGVSAYLNTKNWSSTLRFYPLKQRNNDFTVAGLDNYESPNYNLSSRKVLVSTGEEPPKFLTGKTAFEQWLMRPNDKSDKEINKEFKTNLRDRCFNIGSHCEERMLGDIVNSPILAIDEDPQTRDRSADPYATFVVTAANDGMLHVFKKNGTTGGSNAYTLILDYLPGAAKRGSINKDSKITLWSQLPNIAHPGYGKHQQHPHQYFNNGGIAYMGTMKKDCSVTQEDFTCESKPAQLFAVGSYGQGARGLYAINIGGKEYETGNDIALSHDNTTSWQTEIPLWESGSDKYGANKNDAHSLEAHRSLGYIIGSPILANIAVNRDRNNELNQMKPRNNGHIHYAVITHNGFFSADTEPTLYVFDALGITKIENVDTNGRKTADSSKNVQNIGKFIAKISVKNSGPKKERQSLAPPAVVDVDNDGIADIVYAGDYNGNLYRFDLRKENPNEWTATKIFQANNNQQHITTAPIVYRLDATGSKYVVMVGTGSDVFEDDLKEGNKLNADQQTIYGIYDDINEENPRIITHADLLQQSLSKDLGQFKEETKTVVTLTDNKMTHQYKGWYINLTNDAGERVVRSGKLAGNSVFFTTRVYKSSSSSSIQYSSNSCVNPITNKSNGYLLGINPRTGGRLKRSMMNLNHPIDRYRAETQFISGFKFDGVPSELSFVVLGQDSLTNRAGQFSSGWEDAGVTRVKKYDDGSLVVTSTEGEYYVISVTEPNYIRVRKINSREIF